jgi:hypothetical protein
MSHIYRGPGKYIAICNKTNFDGHYIKHFEVPSEIPNELKEQFLENGFPDIKIVSASWYFLNIVDFHSCVEAIYPAELFK